MITIEYILSRTYKNKKGCNIWKGSFQKSGKKGQLHYPSIRYKGKVWRGNRLILYLSGYKLSSKIHALHSCDNSMCLNPSHLFTGTHTENMKDKILKNRDHNKKKSKCLRGHLFSGTNLIIRKNGSRACRKCMRKFWNKYDKNNREARRIAALARYYAGKEV